LRQVGDLFGLNVKLRCQKVNTVPCTDFNTKHAAALGATYGRECIRGYR